MNVRHPSQAMQLSPARHRGRRGRHARRPDLRGRVRPRAHHHDRLINAAAGHNIDEMHQDWNNKKFANLLFGLAVEGK